MSTGSAQRVGSVRTCTRDRSSRRAANPSRRGESWLPLVRMTTAPVPASRARASSSRATTSTPGSARSYTSPATTMTSTFSARTTSTRWSSTAACSHSRFTRGNDRPRCQSEVWRIRTSPTLGSRGGQVGATRGGCGQWDRLRRVVHRSCSGSDQVRTGLAPTPPVCFRHEMGDEITASHYTREERQRYREKVQLCLDVFERMLTSATFESDSDDPLTGLEVELNLVGDDRQPFLGNMSVLEEIADPAFQTELGAYNIEMNVPPRSLVGDAALGLEEDLRASLNAA